MSDKGNKYYVQWRCEPHQSVEDTIAHFSTIAAKFSLRDLSGFIELYCSDQRAARATSWDPALHVSRPIPFVLGVPDEEKTPAWTRDISMKTNRLGDTMNESAEETTPTQDLCRYCGCDPEECEDESCTSFESYYLRNEFDGVKSLDEMIDWCRELAKEFGQMKAWGWEVSSAESGYVHLCHDNPKAPRTRGIELDDSAEDAA